MQRRLFRQGFLAMAPLWAGAIPLGIAYGAAARGAGLTAVQIQLMSVVVFSAAAQVSVIALLHGGAATALVVATAMAVSAQFPLYGLTIERHLHLSWPRRLRAAFVLTDAAFGIAAAPGRISEAVLLGAGVSMFAAWNAGTALGLLTEGALPNPAALGLDFLVPLTFLAVLVPAVRSRAGVLAVVVAGATALLLDRLGAGGAAVLAAGVAGSAAGAWVARGDEWHDAVANPGGGCRRVRPASGRLRDSGKGRSPSLAAGAGLRPGGDPDGIGRNEPGG